MYIGLSTVVKFGFCLTFLSVFVVLIWYIVFLLKKQWYYAAGVFELLRSLREYLKVLKSMSELTLYSGDRTLMFIVQKTKEIEQDIRLFFTGFTVYSEEELKDVYDEKLKQQLAEDEQKEREEELEEDPNKPKTVANITSITLPGGDLNKFDKEKKE